MYTIWVIQKHYSPVENSATVSSYCPRIHSPGGPVVCLLPVAKGALFVQTVGLSVRVSRVGVRVGVSCRSGVPASVIVRMSFTS